MKSWRTICFAACAAILALSFQANAETQEVAGVVWTYRPCEGGVAVASGHAYRPAIPSNTAGEVVIPSQLGGQPVVKIGKYAFYGCAGVSAVAMSNDVNEVCDYAFRSCSNLVAVALSSNIVNIGSSAFRDCIRLQSVPLMDALMNVGSSAFAGCLELSSVNLPAGLLGVSTSAFNGCSNIVAVAMPPQFSVKSVFSASYRQIMSVTLPDEATEICASAFEGCKSLASVNMPSNVTSIGTKAFKGCSGLTSMTLPGAVTAIGAEAFMNCTGLTSMDIPGSIGELGSQAFSGCTGLTFLTFSEGLRIIGSGAFQNCNGLTSVILPQSVSAVGTKAFAGCKNIVAVAVPASVVLKEVFPNSYAKITSVEMLPGADTVGEEAFKDCKLIDTVSIPEGVISIGDKAFNGCGNLKEVVLPGSLLNIGNRTFSNCKKIVSVTIPARFQVKEVFTSAYRSITSVTIHQDSGEVPAQAFYGCKSLAVITFPAAPPALADDAFQGLSEDARIVVPAGSVSAYAASADWRGYLWRIEADGEYPIVYALHRGENAAGNPLSYRTDRLPLKLEEPTKAGYVFHGWLLNGVKVAEIPDGTTGCISLEASWRIAEPADPPTADYVTFKAQYDGIVWDAEANRLIGVLRLKAAKMNEKNRTVRISGYLLGLDGKKKSVKQNDKALLVPESGPLAVDFTVKDMGQMKLVIGGEAVAGTLEGYQVRTFPVGGDWTRSDALANVEATVFEGIPGAVQMQLLPVDEPVMPKNWKWAFNKAATVSWKKPKGKDIKCLVVDTSKGKTNLSGIKLSYTPKTGAFKGSFKIHALEDKVTRSEKALRKYTVKVTGIVVDGIGYGKAVLKKPANEWTLSVD